MAQVVEEHRERLTAVVGSWVRDRAETEDVLQDVFAEFLEAYDLGQAIESAGAWLMRVARNKVTDRFRRRRTRDEHRQLVQSVKDDVSPVTPEDDWRRERFRDEILSALETLPVDQADVFVMHELEGLSFEEISRRTGTGVNTLLSRKRAAVLALRELLKEIFDELE